MGTKIVGRDHDGLRVVIADDSLLMREGVAAMLTARGHEVLAQAGDGAELLEAVHLHNPDVVVTDMRMPPRGDLEGLATAAELADTHPNVGVLVLSEHLEPAYATLLLDTDAPGRGYLLKETVTEVEVFVDAAERVANRECVVDLAIVRRVLGRLRSPDPLHDLTEREIEILGLMAQGRSNASIASQTFLSLRTVESHITSIFAKLALGDTPDDHRRVRAVLAFLQA